MKETFATLTLLLTATLPITADVTCTEADATITVTVDDAPLLTYHKATREPPVGLDAAYARSGYIHPVLTPSGTAVTGDFPADHAHQHALFFAWRQMNFEGRQTDFWNQKENRGRTSHEKVLSVKSGEHEGSFTVQLLHEDLTSPDGPKPVIRETWTLTVHDNHTFDLEQIQTNIADSTLTIEEYHYGGMAIRGPDPWLLDAESAAAVNAWEKAKKKDPEAPAPSLERPGDFLTSEGKTGANGNHTRPNWVDMHGTLETGPAGIAIFSHPSNFRHPQPVRLHPSKPYFCFSPMVLGEFTIAPGETYRARYRYLPHDGPPDPTFLKAAWTQFASE